MQFYDGQLVAVSVDDATIHYRIGVFVGGGVTPPVLPRGDYALIVTDGQGGLVIAIDAWGKVIVGTASNPDDDPGNYTRAFWTMMRGSPDLWLIRAGGG